MPTAVRPLHRILRRSACLGAVLLACFVPVVAPAGTALAADLPYASYNYDVWGRSVPVPATYVVEQVLYGGEAGFGDFRAPGDLYVDGEENIHVLDAGNGRIVVLDRNFRLLRIVGGIRTGETLGDGSPETVDLTGAGGLYVHEDGTYRICVAPKAQVLAATADGTLLRTYGTPKGDVVPKGLNFKPLRAAVGRDGTLYVVSEGVFQGILEIDPEGTLLGFYGSNRVDVTLQVLTEFFWKRLFSEEQKEGMLKIVPIEYSSLDMDADGFVYAVTRESRNSMNEIKKLDPKGNNILRVRSSADVPPGVMLNIGNYGDIESTYDKGTKVDTRFIDIRTDRQGFLFALDAQRGRVFQYDQESNLLSIFGGVGQQEGTFREPVAVETLGDRVLVLDRAAGTLTVFAPTPFGTDIRNAILHYNQGLYQEAESLWRSVLGRSANFDLAYVGIGKALFGRQDYIGAMRHFQLGYDKRGYDEAFTEYRKDLIRSQFPWIAAILGAAALLAALLARAFRRSALSARIATAPGRLPFRFAAFHPFKAFDEVRTENRGRIREALLLVLALFVARILSLGLTGFLFNDVRIETIRVGREFAIVAGVYLVFVVSNWAVSTLTEGEGRWRDIALVAAYSLLPMIVSTLAVLLLSHGLALREGAFMALLSGAALWWSAFLLVTGLMTVHHYTFLKTLASLGLTVAGMAFLLFLGALVYSLFRQMAVFFGNILTELLYRI